MKKLWILLIVAIVVMPSLGCRRWGLCNRGAACNVCPPSPGDTYCPPYGNPPVVSPGAEIVTPSPQTYAPVLP